MFQYLIPVFIITTSQMCLLLLGPILSDSFNTLLNKLGRLFLYYYRINGDGEKRLAGIVWDHLMANMHCCGVNNYTDFYTNRQWIQTKADEVSLYVLERFLINGLTCRLFLPPVASWTTLCILESSQRILTASTPRQATTVIGCKVACLH